MMMRRLRPYLELVRLPNLFTAAADPLAGWLIAGGALVGAGSLGWAPLVACGVITYAAGMILNDVFDYEVDVAERPRRPLPSGRVGRGTATAMGVGLLLLGPAFAASAGVASLIVASALMACVLGYDAGLKRTAVGPLAMGACRSLNLMLGLSASPDFGGVVGVAAAVAYGLFVVGVTLISRDEAAAAHSSGAKAGVVVENLAILGLFAASGPFWVRSGYERPPMMFVGWLVLAATAAVVDRAGVSAWRNPSPERFQNAVKTGVFALVWLDVGVVASVRGAGAGLVVACLWIPAFLLGKRLYST